MWYGSISYFSWLQCCATLSFTYELNPCHQAGGSPTSKRIKTGHGQGLECRPRVMFNSTCFHIGTIPPWSFLKQR